MGKCRVGSAGGALAVVVASLLACKQPEGEGGGTAVVPEPVAAPGAGQPVTAQPAQPNAAPAAPAQAPGGGGGAVVNHGALAYNSSNGRYGFAKDHPSGDAASRFALSKCGAGCTVVATFQGGCAAYAHATDTGSSGWARAADRATAESSAVTACSTRGGTCSVKVWGCNSDNSGLTGATTTTRECGPGQISPCTCANGGKGVHACTADGRWGACGNCSAPPKRAGCRDGQQRACPCGDGTFGRQTCHNGTWPSGCFLCD